jgi:putative FmdB family regulatory protein
MPTYEYECEKCGLVFEEFQSINAEPLKKCPKEGCSGTVKRLFSAGAGFLFKGSGFYITDYRSDSYKKTAKNEKGPSSPPPSSDAGSGKKSKDGATSSAAAPSASKSSPS